MHCTRFGYHDWGLREEWIGKWVRRVRVLRYFQIMTRRAETLDVCFAHRDRVVVVERTAEDADRAVGNFRVGDISRHAIWIEPHIGSKFHTCLVPQPAKSLYACIAGGLSSPSQDH